MREDLRRAARELRKEIKAQRKEKSKKSKKDSVLHFRIEKEVVHRIKAVAKARDMSLSDLLRRHLTEHFPAMEGQPDRPEFLDATFAWTDIIVAQDSKCAKCGKGLPAHSNGWLAQGPAPPPRIVCGTCYDDLQTEMHMEEGQEPEEEKNDDE